MLPPDVSEAGVATSNDVSLRNSCPFTLASEPPYLSECQRSVRSLDVLIGDNKNKEKSGHEPGFGLERSKKPGFIYRLWVDLQEKASDKRLASELIRTSVTVSVFIAMVGLMTLAQMFSDRWFDLYSRNLMLQSTMAATNPKFDAMSFIEAYGNRTVFATDPLFDHVFTLLPDKSDWRTWFPDLLLTSFLGISLTVTLLFPKSKRLKYQAIIVLRRLLWILSFLYFFRMCSFLVTTVPNPVHNCVPKYPQDSAAYLILMGKMATGKISACTDNIYSGHTTLVTMLFFINLTYSGRWYFTVYSFLHASAVLFAILLTRLHYSVDVLIALFMTSFIFCLYHFLILINIDQCIFLGQRTTPQKLESEGIDPRLFQERRVILRIVNMTTIRILWWMDGMDLRIGMEEPPAQVERIT